MFIRWKRRWLYWCSSKLVTPLSSTWKRFTVICGYFTK